MFDLYCFSDFKPSNLCLWYKKVISMQYSGICTFQHIPQVKGKYYSGIINMVNDLLLVGNVVNINILEIKIYIYNLFFQVLPKTFRSKDIKGFLCFSLNLNSREKIFSWFFTIFCFFLHWTYPTQNSFIVCSVSTFTFEIPFLFFHPALQYDFQFLFLLLIILQQAEQLSTTCSLTSVQFLDKKDALLAPLWDILGSLWQSKILVLRCFFTVSKV